MHSSCIFVKITLFLIVQINKNVDVEGGKVRAKTGDIQALGMFT